eukprot:161722-Hanusia_phi.AAC.2
MADDLIVVMEGQVAIHRAVALPDSCAAARNFFKFLSKEGTHSKVSRTGLNIDGLTLLSTDPGQGEARCQPARGSRLQGDGAGRPHAGRERELAAAARVPTPDSFDSGRQRTAAT